MLLREQLQQKLANKTKPPGSLGKLEELAIQVGLVQNSLSPKLSHPQIVVFAGDHGIAATGKVNPYPQQVTAQMVHNFVQGGAAINVICQQYGIGLTVVDAGVNANFEEGLPIVHAKIGRGTNDYSEGIAMHPEQAALAIQKGAAIVQEIHEKGCTLIGLGEMGIGNSSSAALLMHYYTGIPIAACTGRGTGASDTQLQQKIAILTAVAEQHQLLQVRLTPQDLLSKIGGYEIAMMAGAYVRAYELGMLIVVDGFIATAALLVARSLQPTILDNCVFAHCSEENGHAAMLHYLNVQPILQFNMRLGEGTGAAIAIPLLQTAVHLLNEMASFDTAGVSTAT